MHTVLSLGVWKITLGLLCLGAFVVLPVLSNAQGVSINTDNSTPNASRILELKSTSQGMLTPRMTTAERDAIVSPANGLLVYNTTTEAFNYNSGVPAVPAWTPVGTGSGSTTSVTASAPLASSGGATPDISLTGVVPVANGGTNSSTALNDNRIIVSSGGAIVEAAALTDGQLLIGSTGATPVGAALNGTSNQITITNTAGSVTLATPQDINDTAVPNFAGLGLAAAAFVPDASSVFEIKSTSQGMLTPRMTTAERDAIVSPANGLLIYNASRGAFNFYESGWQIIESNGGAGYSSVDANATISTTSTVDVVATGMTLTPGAGTYKVTFNSAYTLSPGNITAQGATDLTIAYNALMGVVATNTVHAPAFGSGETLNAGVYTIAAAGSIAGTLTLDALGDPNAVFIFRFGGAFSTGASASVILTNGASACNVFWISQGAISLGASTLMKGTLIANSAAVSAGAGCIITGRLFTTSGAVATDGLILAIPTGCTYLDLGVLSTFSVFTSLGGVGNTGSSNITGDLGTNGGAFIGFGTSTVHGTLYSPVVSASNGTFSIYQNGVLVANSSRTRTSDINTVDIALQGIATVAAGQAIDVRWRTGSGTLTFGNRTLTLTNVQ